MNVFKPFKPFIPFRQKMPVLYLESAIKALFKNDEQGLWYDLWDFSTLSQDAAGTIPVTGVEQPVGRVLDKSGNGNNASQTTSTARPKLSSRYNMLANTDTLATQNATTQATSYVLSFSGAGTVTLSGTATGEKSAGSNTFTATAGTLTLTVSGTVTNAQLVPANQSSIPYQRVGNSPFTLASRTDDYDSDPSKFPRYIQADLVDDKLTTTVPAIAGQIALATTKGLWIDDIALSAGDFDIGPTTYTGGPAGLLSTLGAQMIGYVLREGTFSASEVSARTQYYKRKGCPGLLP
jgi:hypothetical protein